MGIIKSLLDLDLYKLTMLNAVILKYPDFKVRYKFTDRGKIKFPKGFDKKVIKEVQALSKINGITEAEANFIRKEVPWISEITIKYLLGYSYDPSETAIYQDKEGYLFMNMDGYYHSSILWETTLMQIVSELYFQDIPVDLEDVRQKASEKAKHFYFNNQRVVEMGTRRRRSYAVQDAVIRGLFKSGLNSNSMIGTSNVHFGMKYGLKVIGTVAHEWYMFHSALYGYKMANKMAVDVWSEVYRGNLGIALPDTFTTDVFLKTFDSYQAKLVDGLRQDSGDEIEFYNKVAKHYRSLGIDPKTKQYVFSNGINSYERIDRIHDACDAIIKSYGIGTWLTNDFKEKALNMVIKMSEVLVNGEWVHVVKISDGEGKESGNFEEVVKAKMVLDLNKQKTLFN